MTTFGERLIMLRDALGLKQSEMAKSLDYSQPRLSIMEKGANTSIDVYDTILDVYPHVRVEWLVRGEGDIFSDNFVPIGLPRKKTEVKKITDDWAEKLVARLELELQEAKIALEKEKAHSAQLLQVLTKLSNS